MDLGLLKYKLVNIANNEFAGAEIQLSPNGIIALDEFISRGVEKLAPELLSINQFEKDRISHATEDNFQIFIADTIRTLKDSGENVLDVTIIEQIKKRLCPLHPFC